ncbi:MAG TPA: peptidase M23 [Thiolapillus brandeum]|uniref:Peptidase M23 n=1 Tax=Thiolapillus brandeum TaxID=1076588 RepID=A0A831NYD1_9GAMM|nr:peptidase M23 [Thiolapillus brandeum]
MKNRKLKLLDGVAGLILCWALLFAGENIAGSGQGESSHEHQLSIQQQKRQQLQESIARLQEAIAETRRKKDSQASELANAERKISQMIVQLRQLAEQRQQLGQRLQKLQQQQETLQQDVAHIRSRLALLLRSAYMAGRQERLKLFLNQQDPDKLSRLLAYHDYISRARARQLQLLTRDLNTIRSVTEQIKQQQSELDQLHIQYQQQKQNLSLRQQQRKQLLQRLDSQLRQQGEKLNRWQEDARQLAKLLEQLQSALQVLDLPEQKGFLERKGKHTWPLSGKLLKTFGSRKIGNLRWDGVIINAAEGQEVRAIHAGRVAWADWLRGYGLLVIIEHGDGYMSLYGNNQSLFKETGDWVETGEVIAEASGGGRLDQMGVYFGIRYQGKALNPVRWCHR